MECPFELPVVKKPDFDFDKTGLYRVESANTLFLSFSLKEDEVDYIVQAINCHEKFKTALEKIADQANRASMVQDRSVGIIKQTCGVIFSEAKQALKEAEKP